MVIVLEVTKNMKKRIKKFLVLLVFQGLNFHPLLAKKKGILLS